MEADSGGVRAKVLARAAAQMEKDGSVPPVLLEKLKLCLQEERPPKAQELTQLFDEYFREAAR